MTPAPGTAVMNTAVQKHTLDKAHSALLTATVNTHTHTHTHTYTHIISVTYSYDFVMCVTFISPSLSHIHTHTHSHTRPKSKCPRIHLRSFQLYSNMIKHTFESSRLTKATTSNLEMLN